MHGTTLLLVLLIFAFVSYQLGMRRSLAVVKGKVRQLHSLPSYYGYLSALWAMLPAFLVFAVWNALEAWVITNMTVAALPDELRRLSSGQSGRLRMRIPLRRRR